MTTVYLFDVDGTLTPARKPMEAEFAGFFLDFVKRFPVYLISGSDYAKICEQVPEKILTACRGVFGCSGAQYLESGRPVHSKPHAFPDELIASCKAFVDESRYPLRTGNHLEKRIGMLNVSVVGRKASQEQRLHYNAWDKETGERWQFVKRINNSGLPYEAMAGGEISVDIVPLGRNKSVAKKQVLDRIPGARLVFFGDRMMTGGNDKPLADVLMQDGSIHKAVSVKDYRETWACLRKIPAAT